MAKKRTPAGAIFNAEWAGKTGYNKYTVARELGLSYAEMDDFIEGKYRVSDGLASMLAKKFNTSKELWLELDRKYLESLENG